MDQYGVATVANLSGSIVWPSLTAADATSVASQQSRQIAHKWDEKVLLNPATGEPATYLTSQEMYEGDIEFVPSAPGGAGSLAHALKTLTQPALYEQVTIAGHPQTSMNGVYNYVGGWTVSETPDGAVKVRLRIRKLNAVVASTFSTKNT